MQNELLLRQRHDLILERLRRSGRVIAVELAQEFGVSEDTVRRDLRDLASAGLCERVYGGALPVASGKTLTQRVGLDLQRKSTLAAAAAAFVRPGSTVFIDAGSTNLAIAQALPENADLVVITNTPLIAAALMDKPGVELILVGGQIDRIVGAAIGIKALKEIESLHPDLCILGTCGIDRGAGFTVLVFDDAEFKRSVVRASKAVLVAVTNEKLDTAGPHRVARLAECTTLVVEHDALGDPIDAYGHAIPTIVRAGAPER